MTNQPISKKFSKVEDLLEASQRYDQRKTDYLVPASNFNFDAHDSTGQIGHNASIVMNGVGMFGQERWELNERALGQLGGSYGRLGASLRKDCEMRPEQGRVTIPIKYLRACPPALQAANLNAWLPTGGEGASLLVRGYDGSARGVLSSGYSILDNTTLLQWTKEVLEKGGGGEYKLIRPYITEDTLALRIIFAEEEGGNYGFGVYIRNGEVGNSSMQVAPFVQQNSCSNSTTWTAGGWWQRHRWSEPESAIRLAFERAMFKGLKSSPAILNKLYEAERQDLPNFFDEVKLFCKTHQLSEKVKDAVLVGSERQQTVAGVSRGLSYASHAVKQSEEVSHRLSSLAGDVLFKGLRHAESEPTASWQAVPLREEEEQNEVRYVV